MFAPRPVFVCHPEREASATFDVDEPFLQNQRVAEGSCSDAERLFYSLRVHMRNLAFFAFYNRVWYNEKDKSAVVDISFGRIL